VSSSMVKKSKVMVFLNLDNGKPISCLKLSASNYHHTLRNILEEGKSHLLCWRKPEIVDFIFFSLILSVYFVI